MQPKRAVQIRTRAVLCVCYSRHARQAGVAGHLATSKPAGIKGSEQFLRTASSIPGCCALANTLANTLAARTAGGRWACIKLNELHKMEDETALLWPPAPQFCFLEAVMMHVILSLYRAASPLQQSATNSLTFFHRSLATKQSCGPCTDRLLPAHQSLAAHQAR